MSILDSISASQKAAPSSFGYEGGLKLSKEGDKIPEKDLFQKYILDKETEANSGNDGQSAGAALEHDSELHGQQGMLAARNSNLPHQPRLEANSSNGNAHKGSHGGNTARLSPSGRHDGNAQGDSEPTKASSDLGAGRGNFQPYGNAPASKAPQSALPARHVPIAKPGTEKSPEGQTAIARQAPATTKPAKPIVPKPAQAAKPSGTSQPQAETVAKAIGKAREQSPGKDQDGSDGKKQDQHSHGHETFSNLQESVLHQVASNVQEAQTFQQAAQAGNNPQAAGVQNPYGGAVAQVAQQIFRMQESGGTSRVTLDMPDGEKLLVRFNVKPGNGGIKVKFSTKSAQLREALEKSWDSLRTEAAQRGVGLDAPEFEEMPGEDPHPSLTGQGASQLLR
jgi:hypothetical protein